MVVGSLTFLVFPILYAPRYHPSLLLVPCIFVVLYFITLKIYMRGLAPITEEVRESFGGLSIRLNESLDGIETVKGSAQETGEIDLFKRNVIRYKDAVIAQGRKEAKFLPMLLYAIALGAGLLHVLLLYRQGLVDIGGVVGYFGLLLMLDFPTFASLWAYSRISLGLAGAKRILDVMNRENNLDQNIPVSQPLRGGVEFRNVLSNTRAENPVLENVSFSVKPGQPRHRGSNRVGKTSLVRLINRTIASQVGGAGGRGDVRAELENLRAAFRLSRAGYLPLFTHNRREFALAKPGATPGEISQLSSAARRMISSCLLKKDMKRSLVNAGSRFQAGSASVWRWHAPSSPIRAS